MSASQHSYESKLEEMNKDFFGILAKLSEGEKKLLENLMREIFREILNKEPRLPKVIKETSIELISEWIPDGKEPFFYINGGNASESYKAKLGEFSKLFGVSMTLRHWPRIKNWCIPYRLNDLSAFLTGLKTSVQKNKQVLTASYHYKFQDINLEAVDALIEKLNRLTNLSHHPDKADSKANSKAGTPESSSKTEDSASSYSDKADSKAGAIESCLAQRNDRLLLLLDGYDECAPLVEEENSASSHSGLAKLSFLAGQNQPADTPPQTNSAGHSNLPLEVASSESRKPSKPPSDAAPGGPAFR